jgi:guanylate kinase
MPQVSRTGVPLVVSAPSGGGKTTLCRRVIAELGGAEFSVSHTTRPRRPNEREGVDYHYVDDATFDGLVARGAFVEWAHVHNRRYGTSHAEVDNRLANGIDVLFDIDVQGGKQILERLPGAVLVYVLPPSMHVLEERLKARNSDHPEEIARRMRVARQEIESATMYTYFIVNEDLNRAAAELRAILVSERLKRIDRKALVRSLLDG